MSKHGLRVVSGALFDNTGKVLMGLRKLGGKRPSLWELPGGKLDPGETPEVALAREWREELGLHIEPYQYIATSFLEMEVSFHIDLFVVRYTSLLPVQVPQALDHAALRWIDPLDAIEHLPCSPAFYLHWPRLRDWLAQAKT